MSSLAHGDSTSAIEVTNISSHGIWLWVRGQEHFLSYENFPWFENLPVKSITNVEEQSENHFYWPDIDVDLSLEIIQNPGRFPLKSKGA